MLFKTIDKNSGKVLKSSRPDWRTIANFSNYEISNFGEVRRSIHTNPRSRGWSKKKPGEVLSPAIRGKKYPTLTLVSDGGKYVTFNIHSLVATAFLGPKPNGLQVLHKDDNGHNNCVENLYYGTQAQNNADMYRNGHGLKGEKHPNCTVTDRTVKQIRLQYKEGYSQQAIADYFGISQSTVSNFVRNKRRA